MVNIYRTACEIDYYSPRCLYLQLEESYIIDKISPYNIYELCYDSMTKLWLNKVKDKLK